MGADVEERQKQVETFCKSPANNFLAEVFFEELQTVLGESLMDKIVVRNHGMNSRACSRDVLDVSIEYRPITSSIEELFTLHLARNSIYHQLPEFLFHPISISSPGMSNREIVAAIQNNRKIENETIGFFSPFDTEIFKDKVRISERYLNLFAEPGKNVILQRIVSGILGKRLTLSAYERYKLFLFLCKNSLYKENLPELEKLLYIVMGLRITLKYTYHYITDSPYGAIGDCCLGKDAGLVGPFISEPDDIEAKIIFEDKITDTTFLEDKIEMVKSVLCFFVLSTRHIEVTYTVISNTEFVLGQNYLGYDTSL